MKKGNNYINECIKNPRYSIFYNGKEVKRYAFYRQAKAFCLKHNSRLYNDKCEIVDLLTGEEINNLFE